MERGYLGFAPQEAELGGSMRGFMEERFPSC